MRSVVRIVLLIGGLSSACGGGASSTADKEAPKKSRSSSKDDAKKEDDTDVSKGGGDASAKPGIVDLAAELEPIRVAADLPALGGAILTKDGLRALGVTGFRKYGDETAAEPTDPFHLGSDTKAIAATVLAKLVEQGKLTWKTTLAEVFPEAVATMNEAYKAVTVEQLLAMRGGFPASSVPTGETLTSLRAFTGTPRAQREKYVAEALKTPPQVAPGTTFVYSNMSFVVAMAMGEKRADASWEDLLQSVVLEPLGIVGAGHGAMGSAGQVDAPWQHYRSGSKTTPVAPGPNADNPIVLDPSGRVFMPLEGWSRFVGDHLKGLQGGTGILNAASYTALHTPLFGGDYVAGWSVLSRDWAKGTVYTHSGSNTQNHAVVWLAPNADVAFLVVTNIDTDDDAVSRACDDAVGVLLEKWQKGL